MAMSGVALDDASKKLYDDLQKKTTALRFLTFHIENDTKIVVDKVISVAVLSNKLN